MLPMVQTYREAIACEALRMKVFAGEKVPMLFGEPETWVALLVEALLREGQGDVVAGQALRAQALEQAPASAGSINEQPFSWIADGDSRLGPVIEAIINGKYYWLPWNRLARVEIDPPQDLRDAIWMPAHFMFTNGGEVVGLIPTRYPDTDLAAGDALALSRATEWRERGPDSYIGLGQRLWSTDGEEFALMDVRTVVVHESADDSAAPPAPASA